MAHKMNEAQVFSRIGLSGTSTLFPLLAQIYDRFMPHFRGRRRFLNSFTRSLKLLPDLQPNERLAIWDKGRLWSVVDLRGSVDKHIYYSGCHEPEVTQIFKSLLTPGGVVFDIGAHIGYYSLIAASRVGVAGQVHSFEPVPDIFGFLERNVRLNGFSNVHTNNVAAWVKRETIPFFFDSKFHGGVSSVARTPRCEEKPVAVEAMPLDEYMSEKGITHVDTIKLDVEGAELFVLQGMERALINGAPEIICEMGEDLFNKLDYDTETLVGYMHGLGYQAFLLPNPGGELPYAYFSRQPKVQLRPWPRLGG